MEDIIITFVLYMNIFISTIDVKRSSLMHQLSDSLMENAWLPFCVVIVECSHTRTL
jgi:hypothetical protein